MQFISLLLVGLAGLASALSELQDHRQLADPTLPLNATILIRINCGSDKEFTDAAGNVWIKDTYFEGGGQFVTPFVGIRGTVDDELYRTTRFEYKLPRKFGLWEQIMAIFGYKQGLAYNIPVDSDGAYFVTLHFVENKHTSFEGYRNIDILLEDEVVIKGLDFQAETDKQAFTAILRNATTMVSDGVLNIGFHTNIDRSMISGIEVYQYA